MSHTMTIPAWGTTYDMYEQLHVETWPSTLQRYVMGICCKNIGYPVWLWYKRFDFDGLTSRENVTAYSATYSFLKFHPVLKHELAVNIQ